MVQRRAALCPLNEDVLGQILGSVYVVGEQPADVEGPADMKDTVAWGARLAR